MSAGEKAHSGATGWEALIPLDWNRLRHLTNEPVPQHLKRWWFSLGGTPAYLFLVQIATGILLTFYYQPTADRAYDSMRLITYDVPFGWFVRSLHKWSAHLMIATVILHVLRVFFTRAFRHPRELNWVFGVVLLLLVLGFGFTGYSLVYEQLSFWGVTVAANLTEAVPVAGPALATLIRGGPAVGPQTLTRIFLLHIGILPALMIGALGLHLTFVRLHGVTEYDFERGEPGRGKAVALVVRWALAAACGLGAVLCVVRALVSDAPLDFIGHELTPGSTTLVWGIVAVALGAAAWALSRQRLAGLMLFLAAAVLTAGKLVRDLMLGETAAPGTWTAALVAVGVLAAAALVFHRWFREARKPDEPAHFDFFPDHLYTEIIVGTGLLVLLVLLTLVFPATLGAEADPTNTPEHIKPEWFFYFQFRILKLSPGLLGLTSLEVSVLLTGLMMGLLFLWPWIDRGLEKLAPGKDLGVWIGVLGFLWFLAFTVWEAMVP